MLLIYKYPSGLRILFQAQKYKKEKVTDKE
jgi:hypothetical protein